MKLLVIIYLVLISTFSFAQNDTIQKLDTVSSKLNISKSDSLVSLFANMQSTHDYFGFSNPDTNSTRLIIFSIFTAQVKNNPHKCKYGAHYSDASLDKLSIKFINYSGAFGKFQLIKDKKVIDLLFFKKENFTFDE